MRRFDRLLAWRSWLPASRKSQSTLILFALLGSVTAALSVSTLLTALEFRSSLRERGVTSLKQVLALQKAAYVNYLEDLREATMVAGFSAPIEQTFSSLDQSFASLAPIGDRSLISNQIQRRVITPLVSQSDRRFAGLTPDQLLPSKPQGLALQQLYVAPEGRSISSLVSWSGPSLTNYDRAYAIMHQELYPMLHAFGLYDIFLVNLKGDIIFSVAKESDLGTNLLSGPYASSGLGDVFNRLLQSSPPRLSAQPTNAEALVQISSVEPYVPSLGAPSVFSGIPVYLNGVLQGFLCAQVDFSDFLSTLNSGQNWGAIGLGATGDILLIDRQRTQVSLPRQLHQQRATALQKLVRSGQLSGSQRELLENSTNTAGLLIEQGPAIDSMLAGSSGHGVRRNLFGDQVLAAWTPVPALSSLNTNQSWGMLTEISLAELYSPLRSLLLYAIAGALFAIFVSVFMGLWLSKRLTSPLVRVQTLTRELLTLGFEAAPARLIPEQLRRLAGTNSTEVGTLAGDLASLQDDLFASLDAIKATNETVDSLSTPISAIKKGVLLLPLIGHLDAVRAQRVRDQALSKIVEHRASFFIWDLAGLVDVDGGLAPYLSSLAQAATLLGARPIFSGMTARLAAQLSADGLVLGNTLSTASLEDALRLAS
jgi:anti-anti-sigma regulatory factor